MNVVSHTHYHNRTISSLGGLADMNALGDRFSIPS